MSGSGAICPGLHIYIYICAYGYDCKAVCGSSYSLALACLILHLVLMAQSRVQSFKDEEAYKALIKAHLTDPSKTSLNWKSSDLDLVVGHHVQFLCGVAHTGCNINETLLARCLRDMFASSTQECKEFAKKLAEALSYCRAMSGCSWLVRAYQCLLSLRWVPFLH